jgi:hypothetical protein
MRRAIAVTAALLGGALVVAAGLLGSVLVADLLVQPAFAHDLGDKSRVGVRQCAGYALIVDPSGHLRCGGP